MKRTIVLLTSISILATAEGFAAPSDEDIEELRRQLAAVSQRLDELAAENAALRRSQARNAAVVEDVQSGTVNAPSAGASTSSEWTDRVSLAGDFRYRYETIDIGGLPTRQRNRLRARTNIKADVTDDIEVGFGLASGDDDPVSTNQTLGGGGTSKSVVLNMAYADWQINDSTHLIGGKFKSPFVRAGGKSLVWDGDWMPEGFAVTYERDWFFANGLGTFLESDTRKANDNFSWGAQIGASGEIGGASVRGGIAYYSIRTAGQTTNLGNPANPSDYLGNTAVEASGLPCGSTPGSDCVYLNDYLLTEVFGEASFRIGDWPALVYVDYIRNSDAADDETGWSVGTTIGQAKDRGQVQFSYYYASKEADSMLALLTDSDFGAGGTDNRGHFLQFTYGVNKRFSIGAQYFINDFDVKSGVKTDFDRLMIDAQFRWE